MVRELRDRFNADFTRDKYARVLAQVNRETRSDVDFRISETPCFFDSALLNCMVDAGRVMTEQLVGDPEYMRLSSAAVPELYRVPNEDAHPHFMTVDFGLVREESGELTPRLVELQAFPSVYGYQDVLARAYVEQYGLSPSLRWRFGGMDEDAYWKLLREVILDGHDPAHVVLSEVAPDEQKTLADFHVYEDRLGISVVDITKLKKVGRRLFYERAGRLELVERIFNRAIVDEIERKRIELPFDYRDELDVSWAGHPNWYYRLSKFSIPFLVHPFVPATVFLDEWLEGKGAARLPHERARLILKPLYSFAGVGIVFAPTDAQIASIAAADRKRYLMQERVQFASVIETPAGSTQAEIRMLYLWPEKGELTPVISLVRMGRGKMMGVDHNRDREFVGASAALFE